MILKKALIPIQWSLDLDDANKDFKVEHIFLHFNVFILQIRSCLGVSVRLHNYPSAISSVLA